MKGRKQGTKTVHYIGEESSLVNGIIELFLPLSRLADWQRNLFFCVVFFKDFFNIIAEFN